ncbi:MAG: hypothetical protein ACRCTX_21420 [Afipia sp.]
MSSRFGHVSGSHLRGGSIDDAVAPPRNIQMLDIIMLALGLGFFVLSIGYAYACDRL